MATFELDTTPQHSTMDAAGEGEALGAQMLLNNAHWFTRIRWLVIICFLVFGLLSTFYPGILKAFGLVPPRYWPWILAGNLTVANLLFIALLSHLNVTSPLNRLKSHILLQIIVDLFAVTLLVHLVGSTETFVSFIYLFHITLSCIVFQARNSLLITMIAFFFYNLCIFAEIYGLVPSGGILDPSYKAAHPPALKLVFSASAMVVWITIWYLVSTLSKVVRARDRQLDHANRQLEAAGQARNQLMLRTTHDLKAPFSGIEMCISEIRYLCWAEIPETAKNIINRIEKRSRLLRERISEILTLGYLRSDTEHKGPLLPVDLQKLFQALEDELMDKASKQKIRLDFQIPPLNIISYEKQLTILFSNLIANALAYSRENGSVEVHAVKTKEGVEVTVADQGIGIEESELPRIFDEYFRSAEASKVNKYSTGLGLAIVKEIVMRYDLELSVTSKKDEGTTFKVLIPAHSQD